MKFKVLIRRNEDKFVLFRYVVTGINELDTILNSFRDLDVSKYHIEIKTITEGK
jgi:hypothetical protein